MQMKTRPSLSYLSSGCLLGKRVRTCQVGLLYSCRPAVAVRDNERVAKLGAQAGEVGVFGSNGTPIVILCSGATNTASLEEAEPVLLRVVSAPYTCKQREQVAAAHVPSGRLSRGKHPVQNIFDGVYINVFGA